jgi:hypothetical protein
MLFWEKGDFVEERKNERKIGDLIQKFEFSDDFIDLTGEQGHV